MIERTMSMLRFALPVSLLLLAGCARTEEASLVPPDAEGYNAVQPVRTPERDDPDVAIGEWRRSLQDEQAALEFGPAGATPLFSLRCDQRRGLLLQRHGDVAAGNLPMMLLTIGSETRRLAVTREGGTIPLLRAALAPSDPLLGALAGGPAQITVRVGDAAPLILPESPEVAGFATSCAGGTGGAPVDAAPATDGGGGEGVDGAEPIG
jgi:hypothetical protein